MSPVERQIELAWAAGFFDGEGSTVCTSNNGVPYTKIQVTIGQKDDVLGTPAQTLERFRLAVGVGKSYRKALRGRDSNQHQYGVTAKEPAIDVLSQLWPYLSEVKKLQALRAYDRLFGGEYANL